MLQLISTNIVWHDLAFFVLIRFVEFSTGSKPYCTSLPIIFCFLYMKLDVATRIPQNTKDFDVGRPRDLHLIIQTYEFIIKCTIFLFLFNILQICLTQKSNTYNLFMHATSSNHLAFCTRK